MTDDSKKIRNNEQQTIEFSEHVCNEEINFYRRVQNNMPSTKDDDGTKETIRNRSSNIEKS